MLGTITEREVCNMLRLWVKSCFAMQCRTNVLWFLLLGEGMHWCCLGKVSML